MTTNTSVVENTWEVFPGMMLNYCGHEPPFDVCVSRDWSNRDPSPDQQRIVEVLESFVRPDANWLHIGIGNSSLAKRFAPRIEAIMGISITKAELDLAEKLNIPNYYTNYTNKYSRRFAILGSSDLMSKPFDVIIDNNPTSFACCRYHLGRYMGCISNLISQGGTLLTDSEGLAYNEAYSDNYSPVEFARLAALFGMHVLGLTDKVFWVRSYP